MRISIPLIITGLFFSLEVTHAAEPAPRELAKINAIKDALQNYKKVESIYVKSNGNLFRSLELLISEESTEEDVKFLSNAIAMYGLAPSSSIRVDETQIIVTDKSYKHTIEIANLYDKIIKINNEPLKVEVNFEYSGLESNYNEISKSIKSFFKRKNKEKQTVLSVILEFLLPKAEALGGVFSRFFQGTGAALTSSAQRFYSGVRVDPSVKSGTGRISTPLPHSQTSNRRYFQNYQPPATSTHSTHNQGSAPVYQKPGGGQIQTWNQPHPTWFRVK